MDTQKSLIRLIGLAYETSTRPEAWHQFLEALAETLGVRGVALLINPRDGEEGPLSIVDSVGFDPASIDAYHEHFAAVEPWRAPALDLPVGSVRESESLVPQDEFERTEFYNDYYSRIGLHNGFGAAILQEDSGLGASLGFHRSRNSKADPLQLQLVEILVPHLQRAIQISDRLEMLTVERDATAELLDRLPVGAILVDSRGRIVRTNRRADRILSAKDGLRSDRDGLRAARSNETAALRRCIAEAAATSAGDGLASGGVLSLPRPSGARPLAVVVSPLARHAPFSEGRKALAVVIVSDGEGRPVSQTKILAQLYGLTPAEAALAALLVQGRSLGEASDERQVTIETVRSQLKQVFAKTETNRQSELVRLVLSGPAAFGAPPIPEAEDSSSE